MGLHCLPVSILWAARHKWINDDMEDSIDPDCDNICNIKAKYNSMPLKLLLILCIYVRINLFLTLVMWNKLRCYDYF